MLIAGYEGVKHTMNATTDAGTRVLFGDRAAEMHESANGTHGYLYEAALGAVSGGVAVAATKAMIGREILTPERAGKLKEFGSKVAEAATGKAAEFGVTGEGVKKGATAGLKSFGAATFKNVEEVRDALKESVPKAFSRASAGVQRAYERDGVSGVVKDTGLSLRRLGRELSADGTEAAKGFAKSVGEADGVGGKLKAVWRESANEGKALLAKHHGTRSLVLGSALAIGAYEIMPSVGHKKEAEKTTQSAQWSIAPENVQPAQGPAQARARGDGVGPAQAHAVAADWRSAPSAAGGAPLSSVDKPPSAKGADIEQTHGRLDAGTVLNLAPIDTKIAMASAALGVGKGAAKDEGSRFVNTDNRIAADGSNVFVAQRDTSRSDMTPSASFMVYSGRNGSGMSLSRPDDGSGGPKISQTAIDRTPNLVEQVRNDFNPSMTKLHVTDEAAPHAAGLRAAVDAQKPLVDIAKNTGLRRANGEVMSVAGPDAQVGLVMQGLGDKSGNPVRVGVELSEGYGRAVVYGPDGKTPEWSKKLDGEGISVSRAGVATLSGNSLAQVKDFVKEPEAVRDRVGPSMDAGREGSGQVADRSGNFGGSVLSGGQSVGRALPGTVDGQSRVQGGDAGMSAGGMSPGAGVVDRQSGRTGLNPGVISPLNASMDFDGGDAYLGRNGGGAPGVGAHLLGAKGMITQAQSGADAARIQEDPSKPLSAQAMVPGNSGMGQVVDGHAVFAAGSRDPRFNVAFAGLTAGIEENAMGAGRPYVASEALSRDGGRTLNLSRFDGTGRGVANEMFSIHAGPEGSGVSSMSLSVAGQSSGIDVEKTVGKQTGETVRMMEHRPGRIGVGPEGVNEAKDIRLAMSQPDQLVTTVSTSGLGNAGVKIEQTMATREHESGLKAMFGGVDQNGDRVMGRLDFKDGMGRMSLMSQDGKHVVASADIDPAGVKLSKDGRLSLSGNALEQVQSFVADPKGSMLGRDRSAGLSGPATAGPGPDMMSTMDPAGSLRQWGQASGNRQQPALESVVGGRGGQQAPSRAPGAAAGIGLG